MRFNLFAKVDNSENCADAYRYGFNGQERDDEIFGSPGTALTAEYWEYDSRTIRRWNLDPVYNYWESRYSCFGNNPINFSDPKGSYKRKRRAEKMRQRAIENGWNVSELNHVGKEWYFNVNKTIKNEISYPRDGIISGSIFSAKNFGKKLEDKLYSKGGFRALNQEYDWEVIGSPMKGLPHKYAKVNGNLTFALAKEWYQSGGGVPLLIDINTMIINDLSLSDFNNRGIASINLYNRSDIDNYLVHGTITLQLDKTTMKAICALNSDKTTPELNGKKAGMYDFEMQYSLNVLTSIKLYFGRNPITKLGKLINGLDGFNYVGGTPFPIFYSGSIDVKPK